MHPWLTAASAAFFMLVANPAAGQERRAPAPICALHDVVAQTLLDGWNETPQDVGINNIGSLVQIFLSPGGTTWSIVVTRGDGWGCVVTAGRDWRSVHPQPVGPEL